MQTTFTTDFLKTMKLVPNRVLVKPDFHQKNISFSNGYQFQVDKRFAHEKHAPTTGTVINIPATLIPEYMPWKCPLEIEKGDYAVYSYESAMYCLEEERGRIFRDENGEIYFMIDYEDIFSVRRGESIIPVNGYILVSPVSETVKSSFSLPKHMAEYTSVKFGKVEYVGTRNECYYLGPKVRADVYDIREEIKKGDTIVFSEASDLPLEYNLHQSIEGNKAFFRMQRRDVLLIL